MTTTRVSRPMGHDATFPTHLDPDRARDLEDRRGARTTLSHFDDSSDEEDDGYDLEDDQVPTPTAASHSHIPLHPIPSMQEAFAESLEEATRPGPSQKPKLKARDAKARREKLLDEDKSQGPPNRLWRFRPGQKCHELRKLVAQIAFGIELLIKGMANSNAQVLSILQGHIDEVDEFLETTMDDVNAATKDLNERLDFLKVPMENMEVFEKMLENRQFRLQIVEGNVKIEHILSRTSTAHAQTIRDVSEGLRAIKQFSQYLVDNEKGSWRKDRSDVSDVFEAMKGNTEGWYNAFTQIESNSTLLSGLLVRLSTVVAEIDQKAGEVSRRTRFTLEPYADTDKRSIAPSITPSLETASQATPPPSPPATKQNAPPRINTMYFGSDMGSFLEGPDAPDSPVLLNAPIVPARSKQRITKDSETLRDTMLAYQYTPPESSKIIPELVVEQEAETTEDDESESESSTASSIGDSATTSSRDDDNALYILQPRTYTPIPPAPIPSPRVSAIQPRRESVAPRGTPDELSIHIEADEDIPDLEDVRETVILIPRPETRPSPTITQQPKPLQIRKAVAVPVQHQPSRASDKEVAPASAPAPLGHKLGHKKSLRERVSLKGDLPTAIHVPPVNALELQRPRYPTPQQSPHSHRAPASSHGVEMDRSVSHGHHPKHYTTNNEDFHPPRFPSLIPSPASERQHFRPVQASPHSPLQQRPHTAAGTSHNNRPSHQRNAPSQMGMSMLSNMTTMTHETGTGADSTRTIKKKRSAFGWLKKAFSLDEEERAMFEARKRAQPVNYYAQMQPYDGRSPRYLDGKRIA